MLIRTLVVSFSAFLGWVIYLANVGSGHILMRTAHAIPNGDKLGHFVLMGILAYLVNLLFECKTFKLGKWNVLTGSVVVGICVLFEEISQLYIPTRTFSYLDLLSDLLGIITFSFLAVKTYPKIARLLDRSRRQKGLGRSST